MYVLSFDTETTGLPDFKAPSESAHQPHLVEIAAILFDDTNGDRIASFSAIVRPDGWTIPDDIAAIHGITQEIALRDGIPEADAVAGFMALHDRAALRVAHNESFDARILRIALMRYRGEQAADEFKARAAYCTCNASKNIVALPPTEKMRARGMTSHKPPNLNEAHQHFFGTQIEGAHRALTDAESCARIYFALKPPAKAEAAAPGQAAA